MVNGMNVMKRKYRGISLQSWILMITFFLFFVPAYAQNTNDAATENSGTIIQGIVAFVAPAEDKVIVKPSKGDRIKFIITEQTNFVGIDSAYELSKDDRVKVWYDFNDNDNRAVQLEKLPDLGC